MQNIHSVIELYSLIKGVCDSLGIEITADMGHFDIWEKIVSKIKMNTVEKLIVLIEEGTGHLEEWQERMLTSLYRRKNIVNAVPN